MTRWVAQGRSPGSGRRPSEDEAKVCLNCGATFTKNGRPRPLDAKAWAARKFCCNDCKREHHRLYGRTTGTFAQRVQETRLTREEHFAYWQERLTPREIREIGASLDFLDKEAVAA